MEEQEFYDPSADDLAELMNVSKSRSKARDKSMDEFPNVLPIMPILTRPFTPSMTVPLIIEPGAYYELLKQIVKMDQKFLGLVLTKNEDQDIYKVALDDLYDVGVIARILRIINIKEDAGAQVIVSIEGRFKIDKLVATKKSNHLVAKVKYHKESIDPAKKDLITAYSSNLIRTIRELIALNPIFKEELQIVMSNCEFVQPWKLCDFAVALTNTSRENLQDILSTFDLVDRMEKALILLKKEHDITQLQNVINQKLEANISKNQREYFLREQLKAIKKELGLEKEDKTVDIEKFEERARKLQFTPEAKKAFEEERDKLRVLEVQSAEYSVVRNYLDWITSLPWGLFDKESSLLSKAAKVLDEDHYGLDDIKERILEYISVGVLKKSGVKGYILCFVGPPGVGKTSIGKSIARALGRKFYRLSLGGMRDESEIRGHRRTYIGAMPGKILQALKQCGAANPIIMLDEVDKLGASYQGDPASALLEVLDPEQNRDFLDHYLDLRFDLSNVLFILTANTTESIPAALKDRMEILRLAGYVEEEKMQIAKKYLIPKNLKEVGLKLKDLNFKAEALHHLINGYCREAGVRNLEKSINKVLRKVATQKVRDQEKQEKEKSVKEKPGSKKKPLPVKKVIENVEPVDITEKTLEKYLGKPLFTPDRFYHDEANGVVTGLAYTEMGGSILYIEAVTNQGKERLRLTGNAGQVMKESSDIAMTYVLAEKARYLPDSYDSSVTEIHLHIPEGAVPKDGPSAGVAMATAVISRITGMPVPLDLAMTGEITLTGMIRPIGGLREKILAARRENIRTVIIPKENKRDLDEIPAYLKKNLKFICVEEYPEVYDIIFRGRGKKHHHK